MDALALVCSQEQRFTLEPVRLADPGPADMVVRTLCTGVSIGTEFALIRNKISWGPYPLCTGYQGVGVVETVGPAVVGYSPGDRVYYRDNRFMALAAGGAVSCVSGTHCSHAVIDPTRTHGVAHLPAGVTAEAGSLFVMPSVGLFGVDMANPRMGQVVVVYGAGLIGLGVVAACAHRGCVVVAIDLDDARLALAAHLGASRCINPANDDPEAVVRGIAPAGADVVFESTGIPGLLDPAIALCREFGTFVWQGNYGEAPISMHFLPPHGRKLTMYFPCDDGQAPCRRAVVNNMARGVLQWDRVITHRVQPSDAPDLFDRINRNHAPEVIGAVINWSC